MSQTATYLPKALTYDYANASRLMHSSSAKIDVRVYVEDEGDIMFWRQFCSSFNKNYTFKFSVYHCNGKDQAGKDNIMMAVKNGDLQLHPCSLICLDADYDLIIDNYHPYTGILRRDSHVLTTHWYSIENLKADPLHLSTFYNCCTLSMNCSIDFNSIVREISMTYYDLLLRLILCQSNEKLKQRYSVATFGDDLKKCTFDNKNHVSGDTRRYVAERINSLEPIIAKYGPKLGEISNILKNEGIEPENCYRMIKGHHWIDNVIVPLLLPLIVEEYKKMVKKKIKGIEEVEKQNIIIEHYNKNVGIENDSEVCIKARIEQLIDDQIHNEDLDIANVIFDDIKNAIMKD